MAPITKFFLPDDDEEDGNREMPSCKEMPYDREAGKVVLTIVAESAFEYLRACIVSP